MARRMAAFIGEVGTKIHSSERCARGSRGSTSEQDAKQVANLIEKWGFTYCQKCTQERTPR